ncbi:FAD dependent oxidoreductase [Delphinella strobiligena]|nr:FAD dependent oxidoreductase [Delphinella strobiligena]
MVSDRRSIQHTQVPISAEYIVIGSGISGALTAFELLEGGVDPENVVILEAREAVSGASGRNAGHVRPDAFRGFSAYAAIHGPEQALKIVANERLVLERINDFVHKHNIPCDFDLTTTFDVCLTPSFAAYEAESLKAFQEAGGDISHITFYTGEAAKQATRIKDAITAYEWPAGSSHPAKLAQWLLSNVINRGVKLYTHCPATDISIAADGSSWNAQTPRGTIVARKIIHCTNAYASAVLPHLMQHITPNKAQAHSIVPSPSFSADKTLQHTMSLRYSLHHFYSLIQRKGDGTMILGASRSNPTLSAETLAELESVDDTSFNEEIMRDALQQFGVLFPESPADGRRHGEGLDHAWTGVIGMTPDSVPYVGAIDELPGQFICAGFNGHGMARIFTCAPGVAKLILGGEWKDTGLPECFQYSQDRLNKDLGKAREGSVW